MAESLFIVNELHLKAKKHLKEKLKKENTK